MVLGNVVFRAGQMVALSGDVRHCLSCSIVRRLAWPSNIVGAAHTRPGLHPGTGIIGTCATRHVPKGGLYRPMSI